MNKHQDVTHQFLGKVFTYTSPYTGYKNVIQPDRVIRCVDSFSNTFLLMNETGGATYHRWENAVPLNTVW